MEDTEMDIILSAVDNASDTFESVQEAAENMGDSMQEGAEQGADGMEQMEESAQEAVDPLEQISALVEGFVGAEVFTQLADALWDVADKAGTFEDSLMRARLEAEGAGIDVNEMTDAVSELSATTGRAGGEIRESFIKATARGITDLDSFKKMMTGAGAQATLFGTDIESMANKFSGLAMRSSVMEKTLASTGITVEELGEALGIQGATIDDVNAKWETMDANQKAAALGMAASMNEGATANEEYKKSWAGLQAQIDIAKGRIERLAGEVLLPVLVPALEVAARVLNWLGDTISAVMKGPLGGLVSIIGAVVAGFALIVPAVMAVEGAMALYTASLAPAIASTWALLSPWLPFIAIGAAIVALIYEIGKAFGWWTDVGSMIDAIWAGIQRLWSAFINHPDVQGFLNGLGQAWNAILPYIQSAVSWVMSFFKSTDGSKFDIVGVWINNIGLAWKAITLPMRLVITVIKLIWSTMKSAGNNIKNTINNIRNWFAALPGRIKSAIATIASVLLGPFTTGYNNIKGVVNNIISAANGITKGISLSGLADKLTGPFQSAYKSITGWAQKTYQDAQKWYNSIKPKSGGGGAAGGLDLLDTPLTSTHDTMKVDVNEKIDIVLDLRNVPSGMDESLLRETLNETVQSKEFISALVNNKDFQSLDSKVKSRISAKQNRARGV